ncbi:hypothetical protein D3C76_1582980 [compost metagenome]
MQVGDLVFCQQPHERVLRQVRGTVRAIEPVAQPVFQPVVLLAVERGHIAEAGVGR